MIDLNVASERELQRLPGVGPVIAARIVLARPFCAVEELQRVQGIGEMRLRAMVAARLVTIGSKSCSDSPASPPTARARNAACTTHTTAAESSPSASIQVNINCASLHELMQLRGVGPVLAQRIVAARPFHRKEELTAVRGIGAILYDKMKAQLAKLECDSYVPHHAHTANRLELDEDDEDGNNDPRGADEPRKEWSAQPKAKAAPSKAPAVRVKAPTVRTDTRFHRVPICREVTSCVRASVFPHITPAPSRVLLFASWNVRNLSRRKDAELLQRIARIINEFDLVALQEARDTIVLKRLKTSLPGWDYIASPLVGADTALSLSRRDEHYAFFYRRAVISPIEEARLAENADRAMTRAPFIAHFQSVEAWTGVPRLEVCLVNVHLVCGDRIARQQELDALTDMVAVIDAQLPQSRRLLVLGDFNVSPQDTAMSQRQTRFAPLIRSPVSTTVFGRLFDNIWMDPERGAIDDGDAWAIESGVFRFDWAMYPLCRSAARSQETPTTRLRTYTARVQCTTEVSDHCPVWVAFSTDASEKENFALDSDSKTVRSPNALAAFPPPWTGMFDTGVQLAVVTPRKGLT